MPKPLFKSGDRVLLRVKTGRKVRELVAVFQAMQSRARVIVWVDDPQAKADDDGMRLVDMKSIKPYYAHPSDQERRARHAARLYRQGIRLFRVDKPDGKVFMVETLDAVQGVAAGRIVKRKTVQLVPTHSLWPDLR